MRFIASILFVSLLGGCLSVCRQETFYRPLHISNSHETAPWSGDRTLEYDVTQDLVIRVRDCNYTTTGTPTLCFSFSPRIGKTIKISAPTIQILTATDQPIEIVTLQQLSYKVFFKTNKDGSVEQSSNPDVGVSGAIQFKEIHRSTSYYENQYTFSATTPFRGTEDRSSPPLARTLSGSLGWRNYNFVVDLADINRDEFKISLPPVEIEGKQYKMPVLLFQKVTDRVCYPGV